MKKNSLGTLLQLHYHHRPCGVSTVIDRYAKTFADINKAARCGNVVLCGEKGAAFPISKVKVIVCKEMGYAQFTSKKGFEQTRDCIEKRLKRILRDPAFPRPIFVVAHNTTLGKNCALSSALSRLARDFDAMGDDSRFFLVVHDFAEEGRIEQLCHIQKLQSMGIHIWEDLYPACSNVTFVTINNRNKTLLQKAGCKTVLLRNPVWQATAPLKMSKQKMRFRLRQKAEADDVALQANRPFLLYPTRIMVRKNPLEAILIATVYAKANLLLGTVWGKAGNDFALLDQCKKICKTYSLPVLFDTYGLLGKNEAPQAMYSLADAVVSTSIAEGFGYLFAESSQFNKPVIGRMPQGLSANELGDTQYLYRQLMVPCSWVDVEKVARLYFKRLASLTQWNSATKSWDGFFTSFQKAHVSKGGIDFGCLDMASQVAVLHKCLRSQTGMDELRKAFPRQTEKLASFFAATTAGKQSNTPLMLSGDFPMDFEACFLSKSKHRANCPIQAKLIGKYFADLSRFKIGMSGKKNVSVISPSP